MTQREVFDWGVVLTTAPFTGSKTLNVLSIRSEISLPRPNRGCVVKISFTGATITSPMNLTEAQTWMSVCWVGSSSNVLMGLYLQCEGNGLGIRRRGCIV